jgi:hypothetical protein
MSLRQLIATTPVGLERSVDLAFWWFFNETPARAVVESRIHDRYHDVSLLLGVDLSTQMISDVEVEERRIPFATCPGAIRNYAFLTGVRLNRPALEKALRESIGAPGLGCLRIEQLLFHAADNFVSALGYELKSRQIPERWNEERHAPDAAPLDQRSAAVQQWWLRDRVMRNSCWTMSDRFRDDQAAAPLAGEPGITALMLGLRKTAPRA